MRPLLHQMVFALPLLLSTTACGQSSGPGAGGNSESIVSGGINRTFRVYVPPSVSAGAPAVIFFHGAGATSEDMRWLFPQSMADRYGYVAVYPESAPNTRETWALDCFQCTWADVAGVDDYKFAKDIVTSIVATHGVNVARVYAVGFSLGGSFVYDLACRTSVLAGAAVVSSLPSADELPGCTGATPSDGIIMLGDRDPNLPLSGGGAYQYASADSTAHLWAIRSKCMGPATTRDLPDVNQDNFRVHVLEYTQCADKKNVRLYKLEGLAHEWPRGDVNGSDEILGFFFR